MLARDRASGEPPLRTRGAEPTYRPVPEPGQPRLPGSANAQNIHVDETAVIDGGDAGGELGGGSLLPVEQHGELVERARRLGQGQGCMLTGQRGRPCGQDVARDLDGQGITMRRGVGDHPVRASRGCTLPTIPFAPYRT